MGIGTGTAIALSAGLGAAGSIAGSAISASGAQSAAQTQAEAAQNAQALQQQEFNVQQENAAPYQAAGLSGLENLQAAMPSLTQGFDPASVGLPSTFSYSDKDFQVDPGYNFALQQGEQAIEHGAAAGGNLGSGDTLKALNDYAQGTANQQYNTAYNRALNTYQQNYSNGANTFWQNQNNQFSRLNSLVNTGLSANAGVAQAAQNYANQGGQDIIGAGNAQAAGTVGAANAVNSGISGATGSFSNALLLQQILGSNSGKVLNSNTGYNLGLQSASPNYSLGGSQIPTMPLGAGVNPYDFAPL